MATRSILLAVKEPQMLVDITQALGAGWEVTSIASGEDAPAQFSKRTFDALLVDFNLCDPDASDVLNQALEKHPDTVRFLLANEADLALVAAKVLGVPHILPKPIDPVSLKNRIENGVKELNEENSERKGTNIPNEAPEMTSVYSEVLKALETQDVTSEKVGEIIARDGTLTSEILNLTKPSFLAIPREISSPVEAVTSLGLAVVRAAVMALRYLAEQNGSSPGYLSPDQIWKHSISVGQIARDLILFETKDRVLASQALVAGLLHDLGKVVLSRNFDDLYGRVHSLARKQPVAIWEIEKEMFGANHGEIGACLVGMWNLPSAVVEAVAHHHEPPLGEHVELDPLAAVHIANVLERECWIDLEDRRVAPVINTTFLNELGLLQRLPIWRAAFKNRKSVGLTPDKESTKNAESVSSAFASAPRSRMDTPLPEPQTERRDGSVTVPQQEGLAEVQVARNYAKLIFAGAAGIVAMLAFWFIFEPDSKTSDLAYARTPSRTPETQDTAATASPLASQETTPVSVPEVGSNLAPSVVEESPASVGLITPPQPEPDALTATTARSERVPEPQATQPVPEITPAPAPATRAVATAPTNVPAADPAPQPPAPPAFRLNGIIYSTFQQSAIVNGHMVQVGDEVNGATVIAISQSSVTLESDGQRKTYKLR